MSSKASKSGSGGQEAVTNNADEGAAVTLAELANVSPTATGVNDDYDSFIKGSRQSVLQPILEWAERPSYKEAIEHSKRKPEDNKSLHFAHPMEAFVDPKYARNSLIELSRRKMVYPPKTKPKDKMPVCFLEYGTDLDEPCMFELPPVCCGFTLQQLSRR